MIKPVLVLFFLGMLLQDLNAQLFRATGKDLDKIPGRTLVVLLQEEEPAFINRFSKKPERLAQYRKIISLTNECMINAFADHWDLSKVEFKKRSELNFSGKDTSGCIFKYTLDPKVFEINPNLSAYALRRELVLNKIYGRIDLSLQEKFKRYSFMTFHTPGAYPSEMELGTSIRQIRDFIKNKLENPSYNMKDVEEMAAERNIRITQKTLLVDSALVVKILQSFDYIKEEYPYSYKLTDQEEIAQAIKSRDSSYAYVIIFPHFDQVNRGGSFEGTAGGGMDDFKEELYYAHAVIDAATGEMIGLGKNLDAVINRRAWKQYYKHAGPPDLNE